MMKLLTIKEIKNFFSNEFSGSDPKVTGGLRLLPTSAD